MKHCPDNEARGLVSRANLGASSKTDTWKKHQLINKTSNINNNNLKTLILDMSEKNILDSI